MDFGIGADVGCSSFRSARSEECFEDGASSRYQFLNRTNPFFFVAVCSRYTRSINLLPPSLYFSSGSGLSSDSSDPKDEDDPQGLEDWRRRTVAIQQRIRQIRPAGMALSRTPPIQTNSMPLLVTRCVKQPLPTRR